MHWRKAAPFMAIGLLVMGLAGCMAESEGSFTVPADAGPVAREADVEEPHRLVVHVNEETDQGPALADAAVVFFVDEDAARVQTATGQVETSAGADGASARVDTSFSMDADADGYAALATGRSGTNGTVTGLLAANRTSVNVLVGDVDGYTREVRFQVPVGEPGGRTELSIPLFHERLELATNATMPTSVSTAEATMGQTEPARAAAPLTLHEDAAVEQAYRARMASLSLAVSWTNGPTQYGDLYAGFGVDDTVLVAGEDERQTPADMENQETVEVSPGLVEDERERIENAGTLSAFALTDNVAAGLDGLPFEATGTGTFEGTGHAFTIVS